VKVQPGPPIAAPGRLLPHGGRSPSISPFLTLSGLSPAFEVGRFAGDDKGGINTRSNDPQEFFDVFNHGTVLILCPYQRNSPVTTVNATLKDG
jgi:hypothetical protein